MKEDKQALEAYVLWCIVVNKDDIIPHPSWIKEVRTRLDNKEYADAIHELYDRFKYLEKK